MAGRSVRGMAGVALAVGLAIGLMTPGPVEAAPKSPTRTVRYTPPRYAAIVIDADTGAVLHAVAADEQTYPASLTKMMTLYLTFSALAQHRLQLEHRLPVSEHAASMQPSKLGLKPGSTIRVEDLILAIVTRSANDAAVVLAEGLGGSEEAFARTMTEQARALGMTRTLFENASGLPDENQVTTARDMAILGRALIYDFPQYYPYFSTRSFVFQGHVEPSHNHILDTYEGADGIKTGFIRASGFNLVASAKREGRRLIGVVFGGQSQPWRDHQMARLLDLGFARDATAHTNLASVTDPVLSDTAAPPPGTLVRVALSEPAPPHPLDAAPPAAAEPIAKPLAAAPARRTVKPDQAVVAMAAPTGGWLVQVGAFRAPGQATAASKAAIHAANLNQGQINVSPLPRGHVTLYRARVVGLAENQARDACRTLSREHMACVVLGPGATLAH